MPTTPAHHSDPNDLHRKAPSMPYRIVSCRMLRAGLGALIFATGAGKMLDIAGFAQVIDTYQFGFGMDALLAIAITIASIELLLGIWMLSGWHLARAAIAAMALNAGYFVLMTSSLLRGLELDNCGCFGVYFASPLRWYSPLEDMALIVLCWLLLRLVRWRHSTSHTMQPEIRKSQNRVTS